jgi:hypothetical protein
LEVEIESGRASGALDALERPLLSDHRSELRGIKNTIEPGQDL